MSNKIHNILMRNSVFVWIALATVGLLLLPLAAMQITNEVQWGVMDFIVMGFILFGACSAFVLVARQLRRKYWFVVGLLFAVMLCYIWAELAVGIFTNLGS